MHKIMIAAAAALAVMAGSANAAYANEGNNLAATEIPSTGSGISADRGDRHGIGSLSPFRRIGAASVDTAAYDTGSEHYQDFAGKSGGNGTIGLARRNGNNAGA